MSRSTMCSSYEIGLTNGRTHYNKDDITNLTIEIRRLESEIDRLKRGEFTEEEYSTFCELMTYEKRLKFFNDCDLQKANPGMQAVFVKIPEGYELACREMREPSESEEFLDVDGRVTKYPSKLYKGSEYPRIVVKKKWEWPKWLTVKAIAHNFDKAWFYWDKHKPAHNNIYWYDVDGTLNSIVNVTNIKLPEFSKDWRDSLIYNPNRLDCAGIKKD